MSGAHRHRHKHMRDQCAIAACYSRLLFHPQLLNGAVPDNIGVQHAVKTQYMYTEIEIFW